MDINSLIDKFLFNLRVKGFSDNTIEAYARDLREFSLYCSSLSSLTTDKVRNFAEEFIYSKYKPSTVNRKLSSLRSFLKFLSKGEYVELDFSVLKNLKSRRIPPDYLPFDVIRKAMDDNRDGLMIRLMYASGLRVSELINLRISDVMFDAGFLRIKGKGRKERFIPIDDNTMVKLRDYIEKRRVRVKGAKGSDYIFISNRGKPFTRQGLWKIIKKRFKKIGYDVHPHTLRHMFATHMIENGANIRAVQEMLGHESISTTQIYTDISDKALEEAFHKMEIKR